MADKILQNGLKKAAEAVYRAHAILVTAGSGMGVDSGLPDFRGTEGLWEAYPPLKDRGLTLPGISTPHWMDTDPEFAWGFFGHRILLYRKTIPHHGFDIIKNWCAKKEKGHFVFTSNVDNQFQKAGFNEDKIVECHGSLFHFQQLNGSGDPWPCPEDWSIEIDEKTFRGKPLPTGPPDLPDADQQLCRPNILMFNDWYWVESRTEQQYKRLNEWLRTLSYSQDNVVVIEIGAGKAVPTVRSFSEEIACNFQNGCLIRINPRDYDVRRDKDISIALNGLDGLQQINEFLMT